MTKHPDADVLITFASLRSAFNSAVDTMEFPQIRTIAIIAEGIPENMTRKLIKTANEKGVSVYLLKQNICKYIVHFNRL